MGPQHREALAHRLGQSTDLGQVYPVSLVLSCLVPSGWAHSKATQASQVERAGPPGHNAGGGACCCCYPKGAERARCHPVRLFGL